MHELVHCKFLIQVGIGMSNRRYCQVNKKHNMNARSANNFSIVMAAVSHFSLSWRRNSAY